MIDWDNLARQFVAPDASVAHVLQGVIHKFKKSHEVLRCSALLLRVGGSKVGVNPLK